MSQSRRREWVAYAFAVLRRSEAPVLEGAPEGLPGMRGLRAVAAGPSLWVVLADAPRGGYGEGALASRLEDLEWVSRCAMGHERVVEHFLEQGPLVPLKLFSLFDDEARAVAYFRRVRPKIESLLDRVGGCKEWGVRLSLDPARTAETRRKTARREASSGTSYLKDRLEDRERARRLEGTLREEAEALYARLVQRAVDARRRPDQEAEPGTRLLLAAAFLVDDESAQSFEKEVASAARALADHGVAIRLSGPWPPYHFVEESA